MNTTSSLWKTESLWSLLKGERRVVIPRIQRDYAQGRKGEKEQNVRMDFLQDIRSHLEQDASLALDFIYGTMEERDGLWVFAPLDGQQRLTTLWLTHWYVCLRAEKMTPKNREVLAHFSYETRASSKDFCLALCNKVTNGELPDADVVGYLKDQTWFRAAWLQDPTVSAMLRTIGGEEGEETPVADNLVTIFQDWQGPDFERAWKRLKEAPKQCPITFQVLEISEEKLPVSDEHYVKMNARGKSLTAFENFKADFISHVRTLDADSGIPDRLDAQWTDVFWRVNAQQIRQAKVDNDGKLDAIFLSFMNRYALAKLCLEGKDSSGELLAPTNYRPEKHQAPTPIQKTFERLLGQEGDDGSWYYRFDDYETIFRQDSLEELDRVLAQLDATGLARVQEVLKGVKDTDAEEEDGNCGPSSGTYTFFPKRELVEDRLELVPTTQKERVYFVAILLFLRANDIRIDANYSLFREWMRVARNVIENAEIRDVAPMIRCMRELAQLAAWCEGSGTWDVLAALEVHGDYTADDYLHRQLQEEKEKAVRIRRVPADKGGIEGAEQFSFFNGTIRFLYRDGDGNENWDDFPQKLAKAKQLFSSQKVDASVLMTFLRQYSDFPDGEVAGSIYFTCDGYNREVREHCWKRDLLTNEGLQAPIHSLLMDLPEPIHTPAYATFLQSQLVPDLLAKADGRKYHFQWYRGERTIHKANAQGNLDGIYLPENLAERKARCGMLHGLSGVQVQTTYYPDLGLYWGVGIPFRWKGKSFLWTNKWENNMFVQIVQRLEQKKNRKQAVKTLPWPLDANGAPEELEPILNRLMK